MRYGSVCSGIEAATVAWEPLGWTPAFFSEIDPFCSSLLNQRYPRVPNYGDFTQLLDPTHPVHNQPPIDVLVGGTPCQDFSIAGLRAGVAGARGSLTLDFCRLVDVLRPRWVVWENVPGVLSSDGGRALGAFTGALAELGYGFSWRMLDAQYFGLAQRRKRVFVVGHSRGEPSRPGAVLLEPEGVRGDPPSRQQARKVSPPDAGGRTPHGVGRTAIAITERGRGDGLNLEHQDEVAYALTNPGDGGRTNNRMVAISEADDAFAPKVAYAGQLTGGSQSGEFRTTDLDNRGAFIAYRKSSRARSVEDSETWIPADVSNTLNVFDAGDIRTTHIVLEPREPGQAVAVSFNQRCEARTSEIMYSIMGQPGVDELLVFKRVEVGVRQGFSVRRLTPRECERLQGFPDDYTLVPYRKGLSADGHRYKALGNSMAVPVMRWIGARIYLVDQLDQGE